MLRRLVNRVLRPFNYILKKNKADEGLEDIFGDNVFTEIYNDVREYTMTSPQRLFTLYKSVEYIIKNGIPGSFVECGVWRGGSSMTIALTLKKLGITDRKIYLYDTFEGMSEPSEKDSDLLGNKAEVLLQKKPKKEKEIGVWCFASIDDVKQNMSKTGYQSAEILYVQGKVEETIPATLPQEIALLRLDTDWYESTLHELTQLYPLLQSRGILIIDDYGHWQGARRAVDEYIEQEKLPILLNRVDYTARIAVKP